MAATPMIQFSPQSMRRFGGLLNEMAYVTRAEMPKVVRNTGRDFVRKVLGLTPVSPQGYKGRGFAKSGWVKALMGLGVAVRSRYHYGGKRRWAEFGIFKDGRNQALPFVEVGNTVPYIEKLNREGGNRGAPRFFQRAFAMTILQMERTLTRMARKQARLWRS